MMGVKGAEVVRDGALVQHGILRMQKGEFG